MADQNLRTTHVPRTLELKTKLFGFELGDVLIVFMHLSAMNLVVGEMKYRLPLIWGSTVFLGAVLYFVKKGKPDHYVEHVVEYLRTPNVKSAGLPDLKYRPLKTKKEGEL